MDHCLKISHIPLLNPFSFSVLLPDGQRGRTVGNWLVAHHLEHLVPLPPRKNSTPLASGHSTDVEDSQLLPPTSNRSSPEKRPRGQDATESLHGSPTKQIRVGGLDECSYSLESPEANLLQNLDALEPTPADVIGAFLQSRLELNSPPQKMGLIAAIVAEATGGKRIAPANFALAAAAGKAPNAAPAPAAAKEGPSSGVNANLPRSPAQAQPAPPISMVSTGIPIFSSRIIHDKLMEAAAATTSERATLAPGAEVKQESLPSKEKPTPPRNINTPTIITPDGSLTPVGGTTGSPYNNNANSPQSAGILLPPRRDSGSFMDFGRVFRVNSEGPIMLGSGNSPQERQLGSLLQNSPGAERSEEWEELQSITLLCGGHDYAKHSTNKASNNNSEDSSMSHGYGGRSRANSPPVMLSVYTTQAELAAEEARKTPIIMIGRRDVGKATRERMMAVVPIAEGGAGGIDSIGSSLVSNDAANAVNERAPELQGEDSSVELKG